MGTSISPLAMWAVAPPAAASSSTPGASRNEVRYAFRWPNVLELSGSRKARPLKPRVRRDARVRQPQPHDRRRPDAALERILWRHLPSICQLYTLVSRVRGPGWSFQESPNGQKLNDARRCLGDESARGTRWSNTAARVR